MNETNRMLVFTVNVHFSKALNRMFGFFVDGLARDRSEISFDIIHRIVNNSALNRLFAFTVDINCHVGNGIADRFTTNGHH